MIRHLLQRDNINPASLNSQPFPPINPPRIPSQTFSFSINIRFIRSVSGTFRNVNNPSLLQCPNRWNNWFRPW
ncbi:hypothetical protein CW304_02120 [Bacillus sp. UFRGS-B20]|nr:hypothetical protein CW304_02120 [Bacillus sp. UFRGS-B20]